jgi:hypothetical protein
VRRPGLAQFLRIEAAAISEAALLAAPIAVVVDTRDEPGIVHLLEKIVHIEHAICHTPSATAPDCKDEPERFSLLFEQTAERDRRTCTMSRGA